MISFRITPSGHTKRATTERHLVPVLVVLLILALLLIVLFSRAAAAGGRAQAAILDGGKQEFEENCVSCHGADATGRGELAIKLVKPPKDLTSIISANSGQFPFWRIFDIIAGEAPVPGHETHQMPDYYARLKAQDQKPGYLPAHVRILELTHYLESIQKK